MTEYGDERELPKAWVSVPLSDAADVIPGQSPPSSTYNDVGDGLPFFQGKTEFGERYPQVRKWCTEPKKVAQEGDILISVRAPVGPTNIAPYECGIGRGLAAIRGSDEVEQLYLLYAIRAQEAQIESLGTGTTFKAISSKQLRNVTIAVAPLAEQRRIVDAIEELFSDLDAGVQALHTVRRQLDRYRQSVLKAAVEGDLTRDWREQHAADAEPADALLDRILAERHARWEADTRATYEAKGKTPPKGWQSRYKEPAAPDVDDLPELPEGWVWASMDALLSDIQAGKSFKCDERKPTDDEVGLVKVSAVSWGEYKEDESKTCLDQERINPDYFIHAGDFLFSRANTIELVGACVIVRQTSRQTMLSDKILRLDLLQVLNEWILYNLRSQHGRQQIESLATGNQESMRNIGQQRIRAIAVPLPSLAEQEVIVEEVERRLSVVDAVAAEVDRQLARADRLRRAILQHAFTGKLVPQEGEQVGDAVNITRVPSASSSAVMQTKLAL